MKIATILLIALTVGLLSGCSQNRDTRKADQRAIRHQRDQAKLADLASRHGACHNWMEALPERRSDEYFTVDLQEVLVRTNRQAVSLGAYLEDIAQKDGVLTALFTSFPIGRFETRSGPVYRSLDLRLALKCSAQQAETLLKAGRGVLGMRFALVASIESVSRFAFEAVASESGDTYRIDFASVPNIFSAKGSCVDLERLDPDVNQ